MNRLIAPILLLFTYYDSSRSLFPLISLFIAHSTHARIMAFLFQYLVPYLLKPSCYAPDVCSIFLVEVHEVI